MAATYVRPSRAVPSLLRTVSITSVVAGDEIDFREILGRMPRQIRIIPDDTTDSIEYRINNKVVLESPSLVRGTGEYGHPVPGEQVTIVSTGGQHSVYTATGSAQYLSDENLPIGFIEIVDITFGSGGTSISIEAW